METNIDVLRMSELEKHFVQNDYAIMTSLNSKLNNVVGLLPPDFLLYEIINVYCSSHFELGFLYLVVKDLLTDKEYHQIRAGILCPPACFFYVQPSPRQNKLHVPLPRKHCGFDSKKSTGFAL